MNALTPARLALLPGGSCESGHEHPSDLRAGLFASCAEPSDRSASNHPSPCRKSLVCVSFRLNRGKRVPPLSIAVGRPLRTSASPFPSWLAMTTGRIELTCVADRPFASRCFPPRLTATQLRSATGSNHNLLTGTSTLLIRCTHKRTRAGYACRSMPAMAQINIGVSRGVGNPDRSTVERPLLAGTACPSMKDFGSSRVSQEMLASRGIPFFYPSVPWCAVSPSGLFRVRSDCPIYERASEGRPGQARARRIITGSRLSPLISSVF
jgi:hypothetical protein